MRWKVFALQQWKENVRSVEPYVPGEQPDLPDMIKLNTNENPYSPSPEVTKALQGLDPDQWRRYPDPAAKGLTVALAERYGRLPEEIFVGVGSDDVLALSFLTFFNSVKPILFADITYSFYEVWANLYRIPYETPALDENFGIRREDYYMENGGIVIANPNAPTSVYEGLDGIEDILSHNRDVVVIVDEAYIDFGGESAACLIDKYDNLLVVQTFSKSRSMAGMRIGYAMGNRELIKVLQDVKYSFNSYTMNQASLVLGKAAVLDDRYFEETLQRIISTREAVKEELRVLGFDFPDSKTNFLFVTHESVPAKELFLMLREKHIFVRYFDKPRIDNYLRVTIGTGEEMQRLIQALQSYLGGKQR